jgi:hypothetical protein
MPMTRQVGRFFLRDEFFRNLQVGEGVNLFHGMVILEARPTWQRAGTEYFAIHPDFRLCPPEQIVPQYEATFTPESPYPKWSEKPFGAD